MSGQIRVLHVEDVDAFADLGATMLERQDEQLPVSTVTDGTEGLVHLETETVDVAPSVETAWATVATGTVTLEAPIDWTVMADRRRLQQLFENLQRNAIEHGGESVTVTVDSLADGFYVADGGPDIPADGRGQVFEMEFSTSDEGTGLGLSIVKQIAEVHGWQIRIEESDSGGARFEIRGVTVVP